MKNRLYSALTAMLIGASVLAGPRIEIKKEYDAEQKKLAALVNEDVEMQDSLDYIIKRTTESKDKEDDEHLPGLRGLLKYFSERESLRRKSFELYTGMKSALDKMDNRNEGLKQNVDSLKDSIRKDYDGGVEEGK
jgi:hypothetical protein